MVIDITTSLSATIQEAEADYARARQASADGRNHDALALILNARDALARAGAVSHALRLDLGRMHVLNELGRHRQAVEVGHNLRRLLREGKAAEDDDSAWLEPAAAKNLGVSLGFLGDHPGALAAYAEAEAGFVGLGMGEEVAPLRNNQGIELLEMGKGSAALRMLDDAVARFTAEGDLESAAESTRHVAEALVATGRLAAAQVRLAEAVASFTGAQATTQALRCQLASTELDLALGLVAEAADHLELLVGELNRADLQHDLAVAQTRLGRAHAILDRSDRAAAVLAAAVDTATAVASAPLIAEALLARAELHRAVGQTTRSLADLDAVDTVLASGVWPAHELQAALARTEIALLDGNPSAQATASLAHAVRLLDVVERPDLVIRVRHLQARLAGAEGHHDAAIRHLRTAADLAASIGAELRDPMTRLSFMDDKVRVLDDLASLLTGGDGTARAEAWAVLEGRKVSVLAEQLTAASVTGDGSTPRAEVDPSPTSRPSQAGPSSVDARGVLNLAVQVHQDRLRVLSTVDDQTDLVVDRPAEVLIGLVRQLRSQWLRQQVGGRFGDRHDRQLRLTTERVLNQLSAELLSGVDPGLSDDRPVVVSADGPVHDVPFGALPLAGVPLVTCVTLSGVPGFRPQGARLPVPVNHDQVLLVGVSDSDAPAVDREISVLGDQLNGSVRLQGGDATTAAITRHLRDASVVHLAGHARYVPQAPMRSAIALADGWVTAAEVAEWSLEGRLVVLSACGTARAAALGGERLGLARAALAAGAAAVVVAKWDIPDADTVPLMADFYRSLATGADPTAALRDAQRHAVGAGHHPYRWAAFEVMHT